MKKVLMLKGDGTSYYNPYEPFGPAEWDFMSLITDPKKIGLVVFCGGTDVSPAVYGDTPWTGIENFSYKYDIKRDMEEMLAFKVARTLNIPMSGICRGAQFLWAMLGGKLIQDVSKHTGTSHNTTLSNGSVITTTSDHHQMADLNNKPKDVDITAWSTELRSTKYLRGNNDTQAPDKEVEAFETENIVAFQFHPEWTHPSSSEWQYAQERIATLFK